jgi:hypothetical protein
VQSVDDAGVPFVFALCLPCRLRLDRLPANARRRQHDIAIRRLVEDPPSYPIKLFDTEIEARIFLALVTEHGPAAALALME